jgi:NNP family nitrate/nitrite transporter-like MFS transporter
MAAFFVAGTRSERTKRTMSQPKSRELSAGTASSRALWLSTIAFTVCFAVWTIFSIIGIRIKDELGLSETEFGLLVGLPILTGSLVRIVLGVWTSRYGGRLVYTLTMLAAAAATFLLTFAHTYPQMLIAALGVGIAGGSFAVGVTYVSRFFPPEKQGTALGIFGAGNVGAAVTKFLAPFVLVAWGWQAVAELWALALVIMAIVFWFMTGEEPPSRRSAPKSFRAQLAPLKNIQVWRFSLYYFFTFGAFVALALWLPRYLIGVYGFDIVTAGIVAASFSIPGSIFRAYGGVLSDRVGARMVMYWTLAVSAGATFILSLPPSNIVVEGISGRIPIHFAIGPAVFVAVVFVLGFFMSLGKAAVYKHVPTYYPNDVGAVGGLVGMIGGLGGFVLPIAFGFLNDITGLWQSCFMLLFLLVVISLAWMHIAIRRMEREAEPRSIDVEAYAAQDAQAGA